MRQSHPHPKLLRHDCLSLPLRSLAFAGYPPMPMPGYPPPHGQMGYGAYGFPPRPGMPMQMVGTPPCAFSQFLISALPLNRSHSQHFLFYNTSCTCSSYVDFDLSVRAIAHLQVCDSAATCLAMGARPRSNQSSSVQTDIRLGSSKLLFAECLAFVEESAETHLTHCGTLNKHFFARLFQLEPRKI